MDSSDFPVFSDGDVKVWIDQKVYQLHSKVLEHHSRLFKQALQMAPRFEGFIHFYLAPSDTSEVGILAVQESISSPPVIECLFDDPIKACEYWENILRALYKIKPNLQLMGLGPATVAFDLADLGEFIGSKAIVDEGIDLALQDLGQDLFLMISLDPITWLFFGSRIRSGTIYREAIIHLVGKWPQLTDNDHGRVLFLPDYTLDILRDSDIAVCEAKEAVETLLLDYSPDWMSQDAGIYYGSDSPMIKAAGIFRAWFAQEMEKANNLTNPDGGTSLYRTIAAGGHEYLGGDKFNFYNLPLELGEAYDIEARMDIIKDDVKQIVAPLLKNESRYDPQLWGPLSYLTCAKIEVDSIPWEEWAFEDASNDRWEVESTESGFSSTDSWISSFVNPLDDAMGEPAEPLMRFRRFRQTEDLSNSTESDGT